MSLADLASGRSALDLFYEAQTRRSQGVVDPDEEFLRKKYEAWGPNGGNGRVSDQRAWYEYTARVDPIRAEEQGMTQWLAEMNGQAANNAESARRDAYANDNLAQERDRLREIQRGQDAMAALMAPYYQPSTSSYTITEPDPVIAWETVQPQQPTEGIAFLPHQKRYNKITSTEGGESVGLLSVLKSGLGIVGGLVGGPAGAVIGNGVSQLLGGGGGGGGGRPPLPTGGGLPGMPNMNSQTGKAIARGVGLGTAVAVTTPFVSGGRGPWETLKDALPGGDPLFGTKNILGKEFGTTSSMPQGPVVSGAGPAGVAPRTISRATRTCPRGYVLAVDGRCYPKQMLPKSWRMHQPDPKPVISRTDQKAIRRADGARKRLVKITKQSGAYASLNKPSRTAKPKGRK